MELVEIFSILIIHWFSDFVLQTDKQAKSKSKNWDDLLAHTMWYTLIWTIVGAVLMLIGYFPLTIEHLEKLVIFAGVTFTAHTITDYFTSRLNSKLWKSGNTHGFFVSIGFDQILHYVQLFLTFYLLTRWR